jgi:hypothetical protein
MLIKLFAICEECGHRPFICMTNDTNVFLEGSNFHTCYLDGKMRNGDDRLAGGGCLHAFRKAKVYEENGHWEVICPECGTQCHFPRTSDLEFLIEKETAYEAQKPT